MIKTLKSKKKLGYLNFPINPKNDVDFFGLKKGVIFVKLFLSEQNRRFYLFSDIKFPQNT